MNEKTNVQVIIGGKQYTICGYESRDYLQHIANHINEKLREFEKQDTYNRLDMNMKNVLLAINLSDDYFKAQKLAEENKQQQGEVEQEMFRMKHEIVSRDEEMKALKDKLKETEEKLSELEKKNIRMETEIQQKTQEIEKNTQELEKKTKELEEKNKELQRRAVTPTARPSAPQPVRQGYAAPAVNGVSPVMPVPQTIGAAPQQNVTRTVSAPAAAPVKTQPAPVSQTSSSSAGTSAAQASGMNQKTAPAVNAAATVEKPVEDVMSGIQPVKEDKKEEKQPSIAAFEFEADPKEENAQSSQNGGKGRKNSNSRRSQNKRK